MIRTTDWIRAMGVNQHNSIMRRNFNDNLDYRYK